MNTQVEVRVHEPYMPGQGPRARYASHVFANKADAQAWVMARPESDTVTYTFHEITN